MEKMPFTNSRVISGMMILFVSFPLILSAQSVKRQTISSYGSSSVINNVLVSQTAGQSFNTTSATDKISIAQGFQQPNTFFVEEIKNLSENSLSILIYPNPTTSSITLGSKETIESALVQVTDLSGKSIFTENIQNLKSHEINCSAWGNGIYLITVLDTHKNLKTLRLIISK